MITMKVKEEKSIKLPFQKHPTDFGYDIAATTRSFEKTKWGWIVTYGTSIKSEFPQIIGVNIIPRSSISKTRLRLVNPPGLIDCTYRGEWLVKFDIIGDLTKSEISKLKKGETIEGIYEVGDRIAQMYPIRKELFEFKTVKDLKDSHRGEGGFGSTGVK